MATSFREFRKGSKEYYEGAVIQYCAERGIEKDSVERKPSRQLENGELDAICSVFNNEKTAATLQSCIDNVDGIMAIVNRGIDPSCIYLRANPFSKFDSCLGYIDLSMRKEA